MLFKTVRSVASQCEEDTFPLPNGFALEGWCRYLPIQSIVYLSIICSGIARDLNKAEIIAEIEEVIALRDEPVFHDFTATPPKGKLNREIFEEERETAEGQRKVLEDNGHFYPQTIPDIIELFKRFDIIHEIPGEIPQLDAMITPFPKPSAYFKTKRGVSK